MAISDAGLVECEPGSISGVPLIAGYIGREFEHEPRFLKGAWADWQKETEAEQVKIIAVGMPLPITPRHALKVGAVLGYEPALRLLAELYDKVVLPAAALAEYEDQNIAIAIGMLAAAGLCDVSPLGIRLSAEGKEFSEILSGSE